MKKFLALIAITLFVFVGCTPEDISLGDNVDITTPLTVVEEETLMPLDLSDDPKVEDVITADTVEFLQEIAEKNEVEKEDNTKLAEDHKTLEEIAQERDITAADCELLENIAAKSDCIMAYGE